MHYSVVIVVPINPDDGGSRKETKETVAWALFPFGDGRQWDWWQIGGRWTGFFDGYDPYTDPDNIETCPLCVGTGVRSDMVVKDGCNGCAGKGTSFKWPTRWKERNGDIIPIEKWDTTKQKPFAVVFPDISTGCEYRWVGKHVWTGKGFKDTENFDALVAELPSRFPGHVVVIVDCHN